MNLLNFSTSSLVSSYFTFEAGFFDTEITDFDHQLLERFLPPLIRFRLRNVYSKRLLTFGNNCLKVIDQIVQFSFFHNHIKKTHKYPTSRS